MDVEITVGESAAKGTSIIPTSFDHIHKEGQLDVALPVLKSSDRRTNITLTSLSQTGEEKQLNVAVATACLWQTDDEKQLHVPDATMNTVNKTTNTPPAYLWQIEEGKQLAVDGAASKLVNKKTTPANLRQISEEKQLGITAGSVESVTMKSYISPVSLRKIDEEKNLDVAVSTFKSLTKNTSISPASFNITNEHIDEAAVVKSVGKVTCRHLETFMLRDQAEQQCVAVVGVKSSDKKTSTSPSSFLLSDIEEVSDEVFMDENSSDCLEGDEASPQGTALLLDSKHSSDIGENFLSDITSSPLPLKRKQTNGYRGSTPSGEVLSTGHLVPSGVIAVSNKSASLSLSTKPLLDSPKGFQQAIVNTNFPKVSYNTKDLALSTDNTSAFQKSASKSDVSLLTSFEEHLNAQRNLETGCSGYSAYKFFSECSICKEATDLQVALVEHMKGYHIQDLDPTDFFPCPTCDKSFKTFEAVKVHVASDKHEITWFCFACKGIFGEELALRIHHCTKYVHRGIVPHYVCTKCSRIFYGPKTYVQHVNLCLFGEYCAKCAKYFGSLKGVLDHVKICDLKTGACTNCNDRSKHTVRTPEGLEKAHYALQRVHCRCCGKCFDEINEQFIEHEAKCGVSIRFEHLSSSTTFTPPTVESVWAQNCKLCHLLKISSTRNSSERSKDLMQWQRLHCSFCGKCFIKKSPEFIAHVDYCAWLEKCVLSGRRNVTEEEQSNPRNRLKVYSKFLQCEFCGKNFFRKFMEFFRHEITCKAKFDRCSRRVSNSASLPPPRSPSSDMQRNKIITVEAEPLDLCLKKSVASCQPNRQNISLVTVNKKVLYSDSISLKDGTIETIKWCTVCGHRFISSKFTSHPCKSLQIQMQSCSIVLKRVDSGFDTQ